MALKGGQSIVKTIVNIYNNILLTLDKPNLSHEFEHSILYVFKFMFKL